VLPHAGRSFLFERVFKPQFPSAPVGSLGAFCTRNLSSCGPTTPQWYSMMIESLPGSCSCSLQLAARPLLFSRSSPAVGLVWNRRSPVRLRTIPLDSTRNVPCPSAVYSLHSNGPGNAVGLLFFLFPRDDRLHPLSGWLSYAFSSARSLLHSFFLTLPSDHGRVCDSFFFLSPLLSRCNGIPRRSSFLRSSDFAWSCLSFFFYEWLEVHFDVFRDFFHRSLSPVLFCSFLFFFCSVRLSDFATNP